MMSAQKVAYCIAPHHTSLARLHHRGIICPIINNTTAIRRSLRTHREQPPLFATTMMQRASSSPLAGLAVGLCRRHHTRNCALVAAARTPPAAARRRMSTLTYYRQSSMAMRGTGGQPLYSSPSIGIVFVFTGTQQCHDAHHGDDDESVLWCGRGRCRQQQRYDARPHNDDLVSSSSGCGGGSPLPPESSSSMRMMRM